MEDLVEQLNVGVVSAYEDYLNQSRAAMEHETPLSQNRALQLVFDLRFVSNILARKNESSVSIDLCDVSFLKCLFSYSFSFSFSFIGIYNLFDTSFSIEPFKHNNVNLRNLEKDRKI